MFGASPKIEFAGAAFIIYGAVDLSIDRFTNSLTMETRTLMLGTCKAFTYRFPNDFG